MEKITNKKFDELSTAIDKFVLDELDETMSMEKNLILMDIILNILGLEKE